MLSHDGFNTSPTSMSDRGLGLNRTPTVDYFRAEPGPGAYLFMAVILLRLDRRMAG